MHAQSHAPYESIIEETNMSSSALNGHTPQTPRVKAEALLLVITSRSLSWLDIVVFYKCRFIYSPAVRSRNYSYI